MMMGGFGMFMTGACCNTILQSVVDEHMRRPSQAVRTHQCRDHNRLVVSLSKARHIIEIHRAKRS